MGMPDTTIILKFGGAAVGSPERFLDIAKIIKRRSSATTSLVVVVSAMGGTTDSLFNLAYQVHPQPPSRELDMLVSVGERISISLLAMALSRVGVDAVSLTGSQSGILTDDAHTDARIIDVRPQRILKSLAERKIVIVAGFQGMSRRKGDITTLGRGGSDTTAVALAAALKASHVEFYKDVDGVYDLDPKNHPSAVKFDGMNYQDALKLTRNGAKVLHARCIEIASKNQIPLWVKSFTESTAKDQQAEGTWIKDSTTDSSNDAERQAVYEEFNEPQN